MGRIGAGIWSWNFCEMTRIQILLKLTDDSDIGIIFEIATIFSQNQNIVNDRDYIVLLIYALELHIW